MPTVLVERAVLFAAIGREYTDKEFDHLCFEFGIELDEVTTEGQMARRERGDAAAPAADAAAAAGDAPAGGGAAGSEAVMYKIDVPANRYDILCVEGLARALRIFQGMQAPPTYTLSAPAAMIEVAVAASAALVRPFLVSAVLRNVTFTATSYNSFLDLQDKLHQNICRRRTLVAIGTHDLDAIQAPFTYGGEAPADIRFVPLAQSREFDAASLMEFYRTEPSVKHIKPYVDIIADSPVFPVIRDARRRVMSLPPIINGELSKISSATRNVWIECTATDETKAKIVLNMMVTMFSELCAAPFVVEPVRVTYADGRSYVTPDLSTHTMSASVAEICSTIGVLLPPADVVSYLGRMQLAAVLDEGGRTVTVTVPPTRPDVLHACDIIEDVAIAYGYNNVPRTQPSTTTVGGQLPINHLTDLLRDDVAHAGYSEVMTLTLVSKEENFGALRRPDDGSAAVLANPKTADFEIVRTSLLPGLLKTLRENRAMPVRDGIKIFELSDVVLLDASSDVGAVNRRMLAAAYTGPTAGFEVGGLTCPRPPQIVHGLVDRVMQLLAVAPRVEAAPGAPSGAVYWLEAAESPTFFPGRCASVVVQLPGCAPLRVGTLGVLHPEVLAHFQLVNPVSALEMEVQPFL